MLRELRNDRARELEELMEVPIDKGEAELFKKDRAEGELVSGGDDDYDVVSETAIEEGAADEEEIELSEVKAYKQRIKDHE